MNKASWAHQDRIYVILAALFCALLILTNLMGMKIFKAPFGNLALTSGIITYPLTFVLSDLVTEIYGRQRANFMVYLGFAMSLFMLLVVTVISNLPPHSYWVIEDNPFGYASLTDYQNAFSATFQMTGTVVFASLVAFMTAQLTDVFTFQKIKEATKGRHLWLRNGLSMALAQLIDTAIVCSIVLFYGLHMSLWTGIELMLGVYLYKVAIGLLCTPLLYGLVKLVRKFHIEPTSGNPQEAQ